MTKATTIRFTDDVFARLDQASSWTGMPVNSIVVAACLEWMQRHSPDPRLPGDERTHGDTPLPGSYPGWVPRDPDALSILTHLHPVGGSAYSCFCPTLQPDPHLAFPAM